MTGGNCGVAKKLESETLRRTTNLILTGN